MNRSKRIENILLKQLPNFSLEIIDNSNLHKGHNNFNGKDETHLKILLKSNNNLKINRLEIHKKINLLLKKEFDSGLHSLEIKIFSID